MEEKVKFFKTPSKLYWQWQSGPLLSDGRFPSIGAARQDYKDWQDIYNVVNWALSRRLDQNGSI